MLENHTQTIQELERVIQNYITFFIVFDIIFFAMIFTGVLLLIRFLKSKKNLRDSNEYLLYTIHGQEEERSRIARELHDTVAQDLRYCKNLLEKKDASANIPEALQILDKSLSQVRLISYNLFPADIAKNDLRANLVNLCASMSQTCGIKFRLSMPDDTDTSFLDENDIFNLYRIAQESFANIIKHSKAEEAVILIRNASENEEPGLYIFISDDGCGFDCDAQLYGGFAASGGIGGSKHFGLVGMKKRCQLIGAEFSVSSTPGEGTQIGIVKKAGANYGK